MDVDRSKIAAYNDRKMLEFKEREKDAEDIKNAIAQLNHEIQKAQSYLQASISRFESFRPTLMKQQNLCQRLELIERSTIMFLNQMNALRPKTYMVEDPQFPNLKKI